MVVADDDSIVADIVVVAGAADDGIDADIIVDVVVADGDADDVVVVVVVAVEVVVTRIRRGIKQLYHNP